MTSIAIVIPAYNVEKYIVDAVESVLAQTILPNEIIIINDGSSDNTADILKKYENNSLIKLFHTSNKGLGEARNKGLRAASSDYIYFFDSDDLLSSEFIEQMLNNIEVCNSPDVILFSGQSFRDKQYIAQTDFFPNYKRGFHGCFNNSYDLIYNLMDKNSFFSSACLYISKKDLWISKDLEFKPIIHEDEDIIFHIVAHSKKSLVLQDAFFNRRIRNDSIMTSGRSIRNLNGFLESLESMYEFKARYPALYRKLKPLWKKRVFKLTLATLDLIRQLKKPVLKPVLIRALYDCYSAERVVKVIKIISTKG